MYMYIHMYIYVYIYIHILAAAQRRAVLEHQVHHLRVVHGERPHAAEGIQEQQAAHAHHEHTLQRERERRLVEVVGVCQVTQHRRRPGTTVKHGSFVREHP